MSPEYRVNIIVPYTYIVDTENKDKAVKKAWELFEDGDEGIDPFGPAEIESIKEVQRTGEVKSRGIQPPGHGASEPDRGIQDGRL